jgi:hypothetical protein
MTISKQMAANGKRQRQEGQAYRKATLAVRKEKTSEGGNPTGVIGAKQSHAVPGGTTRQEAEKACRRSTAGLGRLGVGRFLVLLASKGHETS